MFEAIVNVHVRAHFDPTHELNTQTLYVYAQLSVSVYFSMYVWLHPF